jgi:hypothetical protein
LKSFPEPIATYLKIVLEFESGNKKYFISTVAINLGLKASTWDFDIAMMEVELAWFSCLLP